MKNEIASQVFIAQAQPERINFFRYIVQHGEIGIKSLTNFAQLFIEAQIQRFEFLYKLLKNLVQSLLFLLFAGWLIFLSAGLMVSIFGANLEQEKYSSINNIQSSAFLKHTCQTKFICKAYGEAKPSCAQAGNIQECLASKLHGEDYSACTDDGSIRNINDKLLPDYAQCFGSKIMSFVK